MNNNRILMLLLSILLFYIPIIKYWFDISYSYISIALQVILFIIIFFYFIINKGKLYKQKEINRWFVGIIILTLYILICYTYSEQLVFNTQKLNAFLLNILFPIVILYFLISYKKINLELLIKYSFYFGILLTLSSFHYMVTNGISLTNPNGVYFIENNQILTGRLFGFHLILSLYVFLKSRIKIERLLAITMSFFDIIFTFTAGSRQVLFTLILILFIVLVIFFRNKIKKAIVSIYLVSFILVFFLDNIIKYLSETYLFNRLENSMLESNSRLFLYQESLLMIFENPSNFLFGLGFGDYVFESAFSFDYPHNIFLEIFVETGLIGLLLLLFIIFYVFIKVLPKLLKYNSGNNTIPIVLSMSYLYFVLISLFSFNINSNNLIFTVGMLCLYAIYMDGSKTTR